jgi:hypothetical protein
MYYISYMTIEKLTIEFTGYDPETTARQILEQMLAIRQQHPGVQHVACTYLASFAERERINTEHRTNQSGLIAVETRENQSLVMKAMQKLWGTEEECMLVARSSSVNDDGEAGSCWCCRCFKSKPAPKYEAVRRYAALDGRIWLIPITTANYNKNSQEVAVSNDILVADLKKYVNLQADPIVI